MKQPEAIILDQTGGREEAFPELSLKSTRAVLVTGVTDSLQGSGIDVLTPGVSLGLYLTSFMQARGFNCASLSDDVIFSSTSVKNRKGVVQYTFKEIARSDLTNVFIGEKLALPALLRDMKNIEAIRRSSWQE